jgi:hypothetical protein
LFTDSGAPGRANLGVQLLVGLPVTKRSAIAQFLLFSSLTLALAACVTSPSSRTQGDSGSAITLKGYTTSGKQQIKIEAVDQNTGSLVQIGTATSDMSGMPFTTSGGTPYTAYPWTYTAGVLDKKYWSPQDIVPDLATAQGHLEIVASANGNVFNTFSQDAMNSVMSSGKDPAAAGAEFSDGTSTVLFDRSGVGSGPEGPWTNVQGMISDPHNPGYSKVAWSVGYYTVEGGKKIYGLICTPTTGGPYPVIVFNHGGTQLGNGGNVNGAVNASGWTYQPTYQPPGMPPPMPQILPDTLGQCVDWAKRGWVYAVSSYRGENVNITSSDPDFPGGTWTSDGQVEFCMGEITDVMALTDLLANHSGSISVGSAGHMVALNTNGRLLMYGYSHGGCITHRAVEQGAPVTAYTVMEGFTDLRLGYLWGFNAPGATQETAAIGAGAYQPGVSWYAPDAAHIMGYNWRSAHYFASRGDLSIQKFKTMPILIMHGDVDVGNPVPLQQPVELSADLDATNIFVGPTGVLPAPSQPCISGPVGAALPAGLTAPNATCAVSYILKDTGDPCYTPPFKACKPIKLPLAPAPGEPTQQHYLVVWHNVDHTNGTLAIKNTLNAFVEQNFSYHPGCDGLELDCATD